MKPLLTSLVALALIAVAGIALIAHGRWILGGLVVWFAALVVLLTWNYCAGTRNKQLEELEERRTREAEAKSRRLDIYA